MRMRPVASLSIIVTASQALAGNGSDAEILAIVRKHCVMCHAAKPMHESVQEAPKNIILETIVDLRKHATIVYAHTVQTRAMPLGNQTDMTDEERTVLGRWLREIP